MKRGTVRVYEYSESAGLIACQGSDFMVVPTFRVFLHPKGFMLPKGSMELYSITIPPTVQSSQIWGA